MQSKTLHDERVKTIVVISCVIFAVLMVLALIVSLVSLASASERQLSELNIRIEQGMSDREYYKSDEYIEMIAREYLNMKGKDEITFVGK